MKKIIIFFFTVFCLLLFPQDLPKPKNNQLYTEFTSYRYAPYLKKPLVSSGYIALDGQDKLVFRQNQPVSIVVKKAGEKITYQKGNNTPIEVTDASSNEILIIFGEQEGLQEKYDITKEIIDGKEKFTVIPKKNNRMKSMILFSAEDVLEKLEINFSDRSRLVYEFKNAVTGVSPDKKYFE